MPFTPLDQPEREGSPRGFVPIEDQVQEPARGFVPIEPEKPSVLRNIALNNPLTALGETVMNLASQGVAVPVAGLAGLGTEAARAAGLTENTGTEVIHQVGDALTYTPRGEMGQAATKAVMYPFEKLAEAGRWAGDKTLDATGSPALATAVDTAINAAPMVVAPAFKTGKSATANGLLNLHRDPSPQFLQRALRMPEDEAVAHFEAWQQSRKQRIGGGDGVSAMGDHGSVRRVAEDAQSLPEPGGSGLEELRRPGRDGVPAVAEQLSDLPEGRGAETGTGPAALAGADRLGGELRTGERGLVEPPAADITSPVLPPDTARRWIHDDRGSRPGDGVAVDDLASAATGSETQRGAGLDAGARAVPDRFEVPDAQRPNPDGAGMGVRPEYSGADLAGANSTRRSAAADAGLATDQSPVKSFSTRKSPVTENGVEPLGGRDIVLGRTVRDLDDATLNQWREMVSLSDEARAKLLREVDRRAAVSTMDASTVVADTKPQIAGRTVTSFDDAALARVAGSKLFSERARALAAAEIERRQPVAQSPVRAQVGEPAPIQAMAEPVQNSFAPGANYAGFIDDSRGPVATPVGISNAKPITREEVLTPFMKALDVPIYEGRIKGGNKLGHYRPQLEEVRIRRKSDLETAAHEMAHLIDDRVPEIRVAYRDKTLASELKSVSYDQQSVKEGFAEFVRLYMTQPELAAERAPAFSKWFDGFVQRHEYGPAIQKARDGMTSWFRQEAVDRARSKIGTQLPINEALDGTWDKFRQATVDDLHGVYRMERDLKGGIEKLGAYETTRLSRASHSIADGALRWGAPYRKPDGSFGFKGQGLEEILKPVSGNLNDALLYFVGRSANELMGQGREHLFSRGEVDAMLRLETPERARAFADYQEFNRTVLDFAEGAGVINPEARALWQRTQYLPFHRVGQPGGLKGKPGDWKGVQALTGGTENLRDILGNMTANAAMLIDKAVKNESRQRIAELAEQPGGARFMVKINTETRPVKVAGNQVLEAMLKRYGIAIDGDAPAFFEFMIHGQPPAGANVVAVLKEGKPTWYEVADPLLYRALSAIDRPVQSEVVKWLGLPKRVGQATITLTPDFWTANIARDTLMGSVMSRAGFRPVIDSLQGMRLRMTNDPLYKEFIANGGGMSSIFLDETRFRARLERFYRRQDMDPRVVLDAPDKLLNFVETLGDAFEMSTRLGEYRRAVAAGEHPRHAAYLGREVSTDFAMKGDSRALGFMYDTVMFLRPALVSWDRLGRGLAHDPNRGAIAAKAGSIALMSAALYLLNRDDPRYADMEDWKKDSYWHFFVGEQHFMWPKIWEVGSVASLAERTVEKVIAEDPAGLGKDFARVISNTFHLNLMPQIVAPLVEQATNTNSFTKGKIETPGMENIQPFLRAKPGTSETMRALGMATADMPEALQVNPVRAEALLRGYFNTWAMYGLMLSDVALFGDQLPEKRADELPVVRRFYANEPAKHTRFETEFYEMLGEAKRLRGTLKELDELGRADMADRKEDSPLAGEAKPLEHASKNLRAINNESEAIRRNTSLIPTEKRERLDALTVERNTLLKETVAAAKAAQVEKAQ